MANLRSRRPSFAPVRWLAALVVALLPSAALAQTPKVLADFTWTPTEPQIGQTIVFQIAGVSSVSSAEWDLGAPGCSPYTQTATCTPTPPFTDCLSQAYEYAAAGTHTVTLRIDGGDPIGHQVTVLDEGSCDGGGSCTYAISPTSATYGPAGGAGTIAVSASQPDCSWSASSDRTWIHLTAGVTGQGDGTVSYAVTANSGEARSGNLTVAGHTFTVTQAGGTAGEVTFTVSELTPDIGEVVTFRAGPGCLTPQRWSLGGESCDGDEPEIDCSDDPVPCRTVTWRYRWLGAKTIRLVCAEGEATGTISVRAAGSCAGGCDADGPPDASFTIVPNPALVGQPVTFTDTSGESPKVLADFTWTPTAPQIGQTVTFQFTGVSSVSSAEWAFGAPGCAPYTQTATCTPTPPFIDCMEQTYRYAVAGTHSVTVRLNGGGTITHQVTVRSEGSCDGGGCTYSLDPVSADVPAAAGSSTVSVSTQAGCTWTAQPNSSWLQITSGASSIGSDTVSYSWQANAGAQRSGGMTIAGRYFSVTQAAGGGYLPTEWQWTVSLDGQTVATSDQPAFTHTFAAPGDYSVTLTASNCEGSDTAAATLTVGEQPQPTVLVVPAAARTPGLNGTTWRSDVSLHNPGDETASIALEFLPEGQDNSSSVLYGLVLGLPSRATRTLPDVLDAISGLTGDSLKGSLRVTFNGDPQPRPVVVSRTYNDTPDGTFGQNVPAVAAGVASPSLYLTGLVHDDAFRTNLGLVNLGSEPAVSVAVWVLDEEGLVLGSRMASVPPWSSTMLVNLAPSAGVTEDLDLFSVRVDPGGASLAAYASVVDNHTGDPVLHLAGEPSSGTGYLTGLAHLAGAQGSTWRSDLALFNPGTAVVEVRVDYVPEVDLGAQYFLDVPLAPGASSALDDVLGVMVGPDASTKGYARVSTPAGGAGPLVAARTYNLGTEGTFGQGLPLLAGDALLQAGQRGAIAGVRTSADPLTGFRSNLGLVNTDPAAPATVEVTLYGPDGEELGQIESYPLAAGQYVQFELFGALGLSGLDLEGSVELRVLAGGPVAAYASVVDNRTQDPVFVPAQPR